MERGTYYRGMVVYGETTWGAFCSWSKSKDVAIIFTEQQSEWQEGGEGVVYESTTTAMSLEKLVKGIKGRLKEEKRDTSLAELLERKYKAEQEYIARMEEGKTRKVM